MRDGGLGSQNGGHLDPLLRELLDFDVAIRDPSDGTWRLSEQAQERLDRLAAPRPPAEKIIFFGHRCSICRQIRPTRMRATGLICDECDVPAVPAVWAAPVAGAGPVAVPGPAAGPLPVAVSTPLAAPDPATSQLTA